MISGALEGQAVVLMTYYLSRSTGIHILIYVYVYNKGGRGLLVLLIQLLYFIRFQKKFQRWAEFKYYLFWILFFYRVDFKKNLCNWDFLGANNIYTRNCKFCFKKKKKIWKWVFISVPKDILRKINRAWIIHEILQ